MPKARNSSLPGYSNAYQTPGGFWLENDIAMPGWTVAARYIESDTGPMIAELRVIPGPIAHGPGTGEVRVFGPHWDATAAVPAGGVDRELLKRVPFSALADAAASVRRFWDPTASVVPTIATVHAKRPGRRGHPAEFLAAVALLYVSAIEAGRTDPNLDVSDWLESFGQPLSIHTVRGLVKKARERGYLSRPRQPRQGGGHLTQEAIWVLKRAGVHHHLLQQSTSPTERRESGNGEH